MSELYSFGAWVRRRRRALDLTREELAPQVGCSVVTIRFIEADERRPSKQLAARLADYLQLSPEERPAFLQAARGELAVDRLAAPAASVVRSSAGGIAPAERDTAALSLPRGTVTFLFTDIEASTRLWAQNTQRMGTAIARHEAILRAVMTAAGGVVFKTVGDALYAAFASALDAVRAALEGQRAITAEPWGTTTPLRVRMALHTGVVEERNGDYFGLPLSRIARLLAAGHGGQILLSQTTQDLVREQLVPELTLQHLGRYRLKDLTDPQHIFQLVAPDLPADFPLLKTLELRRTNLPAQSTALIGRAQQVAAVVALLRRPDVRLVTLSGPGGVGKTRLALQVAAELLDEHPRSLPSQSEMTPEPALSVVEGSVVEGDAGLFPDSVWYVNLAPISEPDRAASAIAQAFDVRESGGQPIGEHLKDYLREKRLLLLLDNFEQIVDAAPLVGELLATAPGLRVLITSRIALRLSGEREFAVPPLSLPERAHLPPLDRLTRYTAVRLFIERAQAVKTDFAVTSENALAVAEICYRLDGLPLAIELAAARVKLFPPHALLMRLGNRLTFLTGGARDLPARQQTIRDMIEWSYQLLDQGEQRLFARLAVFAGGCTIEAAEAVCNADGDLPLEVVDGIAALLDKSLLRQTEDPESDPRVVMLETIHEYALEQLATSPDAETIRQQHVHYFTALAEAAAAQWDTPMINAAVALQRREHDNMRAALQWACDTGNSLVGLQLAQALWGFWRSYGYTSEGRAWFQHLLTLDSHPTDVATIAARQRALHAAAWLASDQHDYATATRLFEQSVALRRALGETEGEAALLLNAARQARAEGHYQQATALLKDVLAGHRAEAERTTVGNAGLELSFDELGQVLRELGLVLRELGDFERATALFEEGLAIHGASGDRVSMALELLGLADVARDRGDSAGVRAHGEPCLAILREFGMQWAIGFALNNLALAAYVEGDLTRARALADESVALFRSLQADGSLAEVLITLGQILQAQGDVSAAHAALTEALRLAQALGPRLMVAAAMEGLANVVVSQGDAELGARLLASASVLRAQMNTRVRPVDQAMVDHALATARSMIGADAFAAVWMEAQALPVEQILSGLPSFAVLTAGGLAATERATPTLSLPSGTVTFLFIDTEGSTQLWNQNAQTMGPAIARHEAILRAVMTAAGGVVFKTVGDSIYVAFASALDAVGAAVAGQRALAAEPWGTATLLHVRMALHSGVVEERNGDYFGLPLSRIARLLAAGHGGQILLSQITQELVREQLVPGVTLRHLGRYRLTDLTDPQHIFQLVAPDLPADFPPLRLSTERGVDEPPLRLPPFLAAAAPPPGPAASFVAREQELAELAAALATARSGAGQVLFVIGGAGRGKTMLVQEFARQAQAADAEMLVVSGYSNAHTGSGDPYLPFREALTMLSGDVEARWAGGLISTEHAARLWEAMPLTLPALVEHAPDLIGAFVPGKGVRERAATFADRDAPWWGQLVALASADAGARVAQQPIVAQYTAALSAIARERPLLLILEDLHWVDSASSGLLLHLSREASRSRMLILGTYRPDELAVSRGEIAHPLAEILSELKRQHGDIWLDLGELAEADGRHFVETYLDTQPNRLGADFREALFKRTGGHALFTVELLREMQERGDVRQDEDGQWTQGPAIDWNVLPARVEGAIEKRIQRLETALRSILTVASVEGETFTAEVVARIQQLNERGLIQRLSQELDKQHRLVTAHILARLGPQRLSLYRFRHQLFQQYVYQSLAEMERVYLHEAVGSVLESIYGEQTEHIAVQLARHFEQAGLMEKAVTYLLQAGKRAAQLSAYQETITHVTKGLALLNSLPETRERAQTELELHIALGTALSVTKGHGTGEVEHTYSRAGQLSQQVYAGETARILPILFGRWAHYFVRAEYRTAYQLAEEFLDLAQHQHDPGIIVAHACVGLSSTAMGELVSARAHFEQIAALYNVEQHRPLTFQYGQEPGSAGLSIGALDLWLLGYPEQARRWNDRAVMLAREAAHPYTLAAALSLSSWCHHFCQDRAVAQEQAEEAIAIATKQGLASLLAWATIFRGWALARQGQGEAGIAQIRQGLAALRATETADFRTNHLTLLADAYQTVGEPEAGLATLAEAAALVEKTEERFWEAEIYRLKGELLLNVEGAGRSLGVVAGIPDAESPEGCFLTAIAIARRQAGKSLELRATVSLARLWQQQGKKDQARRMLAAIYGWFTEGFDTIDVQQAKALLQELSA